MMHHLAAARERFDAVLFDLDGTLLDRDSRVTARTHRAVRALVDAGFEVLLCTGRGLAGTTSIHRGLGLTTPVATYNGSWIGHPGRRPWRLATIPDAFLPDVELGESRSCFYFRHESSRKFGIAGGHRHYERVARWYENVVHVSTPTHLPRKELMRVSCFYGGEADTHSAWASMREEARAALVLQEYPLRLFTDFADTDLHLGEIQPRTRGKAEVLDWLEQERGIPASRTVAVGDQRNDLSMLEAAGLAVVVENGVAEAKALADVLVGHHGEDGIARWIEGGMATNGGSGAV